MPQVMAPTPPSTVFIPVNNSVAQSLGMQPRGPTQPASLQPPVSPAAAPPTVQTVDTSNVPGNFFSSLSGRDYIDSQAVSYGKQCFISQLSL